MIPNVKTKLLQGVTKERDKYFTRNESSNRKSDELVQATAATIGFVSEIVHHRKEKAIKKIMKNDSTPSQVSNEVRRVTEDEGRQQDPNIKDLAAAFLHRHPTSTVIPSQESTNLPFPILIPQRRPNTRARGFAPAYAPILSSFDMSQTKFLDFIITLNASLEPNPYLNAINLAGFAGEASPEPIISLMVGLGVEVVTDVIMEAQSRAKSNGFLDKVNEGFFKPRGLFAFVGTWRPHDVEDEQVVDVNIHANASTSHSEINVISTVKNVAAGNASAQNAWRELRQQMQRAIVPAGGEVATLNSAPLIWATAEEVAAATPSYMLKEGDRFDRAGLWLDNHVDKHSQIRWTQEHPDHPLAGSLPKPEFRSRYADPSHAASSGDIVALLTGGQWHMREDEKKKKKEMRKEQEKAEKEQKKLEAKAKKERAKQDKASQKNAGCENKDTAVGDRSKDKSSNNPIDSPGGHLATATPSSEGKRESAMQSHDSSERHEDVERLSNGVGSLLKSVSCKPVRSLKLSLITSQNLLYLVILQQPALTNGT